jgi:hypothetical protein
MLRARRFLTAVKKNRNPDIETESCPSFCCEVCRALT